MRRVFPNCELSDTWVSNKKTSTQIPQQCAVLLLLSYLQTVEHCVNNNGKCFLTILTCVGRLELRHAATKGQTSGSKTDRVESTFNSWEDANAVPSAFVPAQLCLSSLVPDVQSYMDQVCMEHLWQEYPNFPPPRQDNGRNKA